MVIDVTDQSFEEKVLKSDQPVVVDFWAPWCGPCLTIALIADKLSNEYSDKVKFYKLNVDLNPVVAKKYQVMSIPLLLFFKNGQMVDQSLGAIPEDVVRPKVEALL